MWNGVDLLKKNTHTNTLSNLFEFPANHFKNKTKNVKVKIVIIAEFL